MGPTPVSGALLDLFTPLCTLPLPSIIRCLCYPYRISFRWGVGHRPCIHYPRSDRMQCGAVAAVSVISTIRSAKPHTLNMCCFYSFHTILPAISGHLRSPNDDILECHEYYLRWPCLFGCIEQLVGSLLFKFFASIPLSSRRQPTLFVFQF